MGNGGGSAGTIVDPNYIDGGALREQDHVSLDAFLAYQDRAKVHMGPQPFFSGRESEIRIFRQVLNALSMGVQGDATVVVEGPPGAGKSALLSQFVREIRELPNIEEGGLRWLPVIIDGASAECPSHIGQAIDEAISKRLAEDYERAFAPNDKARGPTICPWGSLRAEPVDWQYTGALRTLMCRMRRHGKTLWLSVARTGLSIWRLT